MVCDICGQREATVHLTEIINQNTTEVHLCEQCAQEKGAVMKPSFSLADLLAGLSGFPTPAQEQAESAHRCPQCNMSYADFKRIGRLGCSQCYTTMRAELLPLLKRIHSASKHAGRSPQGQGSAAAKKSAESPQIRDLQKQLEKAVASEEFEEAAKLRDQLRSARRQAKPSQDPPA